MVFIGDAKYELAVHCNENPSLCHAFIRDFVRFRRRCTGTRREDL
jgi:hypothetical protein